MLFIIDGNSEHAAQALRKIGFFLDKIKIRKWFNCNQMPLTGQITDIASYVLLSCHVMYVLWAR